MREILRIGTRPSRLALRQAEEIKTALPLFNYEVVTFETKGDKDKVTPFSEIEGTDFFTREIEEALLGGRIDAAVHSAKDLEETTLQGLTIAAITPCLSPFECLVSRGNKSLSELGQGARVGTSSQKRKDALLRYRRDLKVCDVRGNIEERLQHLDTGAIDALIIAHAALIRLGLEDRISEIINPQIIPPHPLQGSLAIQVRADNLTLINLFKALNKEAR